MGGAAIAARERYCLAGITSSRLGPVVSSWLQQGSPLFTVQATASPQTENATANIAIANTRAMSRESLNMATRVAACGPLWYPEALASAVYGCECATEPSCS